ncbi:hypothetical protein [Proteus sp. TJ1640]|nr:hypothetical protein [Proteus sp. TJ1640]
MTNGILNAIAETGDVVLFAGDSAFDATAASVPAKTRYTVTTTV